MTARRTAAWYCLTVCAVTLVLLALAHHRTLYGALLFGIQLLALEVMP